MIISIIISIILVAMALVVLRVFYGPTTYDRILAANTFGTKVVVLIALLGYLAEDTMFLDIALIYVLINFITTIGFLKYFKHHSLGKE